MNTLVVKEELLGIIRELGFSGVKEVLEEHLVMEIESRISSFEQEVAHFERKYGKPFEEIKREYGDRGENFEIYEDLMAWQFAMEGLGYWKRRLEELKSAL